MQLFLRDVAAKGSDSVIRYSSNIFHFEIVAAAVVLIGCNHCLSVFISVCLMMLRETFRLIGGLLIFVAERS